MRNQPKPNKREKKKTKGDIRVSILLLPAKMLILIDLLTMHSSLNFSLKYYDILGIGFEGFARDMQPHKETAKGSG